MPLATITQTATHEPLDLAALAKPVEGFRLAAGTFGDQLDRAGTLVIFLRHLGCPFCREVVGDLADPALGSSLPPILFIHPAKPDEGNSFFAVADPLARAVCDFDGVLAAAFGVARGGLGALLHPAVVACGIRAMRKGYGVGRIQGDVWRLPGFFLVKDGAIAWAHRATHASDHPDLPALAPQLLALSATATTGLN